MLSGSISGRRSISSHLVVTPVSASWSWACGSCPARSGAVPSPVSPLRAACSRSSSANSGVPGTGSYPPGGPGVAAQQPPAGQPAAADRAVHLDGPQRVRRAARVVAADVAVERADDQPVDLEQADQHVLHERAASRAQRRSDQAAARSPAVRPGARRPRRAAPARRRRSRPGSGRARSAARCRSRRLTRLRRHRVPDRLGDDETHPDSRVVAPPTGRRARTSVGRPTRTPAGSVGGSPPACAAGTRAGSTDAQPRRLRPTAWRDPCGGGRRGSRDRRGWHAETEAVGTAATPVARLEGALAHGSSPSSSRSTVARSGARESRAEPTEVAGAQRPANGTGTAPRGQTSGVARGGHRHRPTQRTSAPCPADTPYAVRRMFRIGLRESTGGC